MKLLLYTKKNFYQEHAGWCWYKDKHDTVKLNWYKDKQVTVKLNWYKDKQDTVKLNWYKDKQSPYEISNYGINSYSS